MFRLATRIGDLWPITMLRKQASGTLVSATTMAATYSLPDPLGGRNAALKPTAPEHW